MATEQRQRDGFNPVSRSLNWMENLSEESYAYVLLAPSFAVLTAIALWPLWRTFRVSLFEDNLFGCLDLLGQLLLSLCYDCSFVLFH